LVVRAEDIDWEDECQLQTKLDIRMWRALDVCISLDGVFGVARSEWWVERQDGSDLYRRWSFGMYPKRDEEGIVVGYGAILEPRWFRRVSMWWKG